MELKKCKTIGNIFVLLTYLGLFCVYYFNFFCVGGFKLIEAVKIVLLRYILCDIRNESDISVHFDILLQFKSFCDLMFEWSLFSYR